MDTKINTYILSIFLKQHNSDNFDVNTKKLTLEINDPRKVHRKRTTILTG